MVPIRSPPSKGCSVPVIAPPGLNPPWFAATEAGAIVLDAGPDQGLRNPHRTLEAVLVHHQP